MGHSARSWRTCHTVCRRPVVMEGCFAAVGALMLPPRASTANLTANSSAAVDWIVSVRAPHGPRTLNATSSAHTHTQDPGSLGLSCVELSQGPTQSFTTLRSVTGSLCSYGFYSLQVHDGPRFVRSRACYHSTLFTILFVPDRSA